MVGSVYGLHLTLRVVDVVDRATLGDVGAVERFLHALVARVGMSVLAGPVVGTEGGGPARAGVSGVVILAESHAAIHTYPGLGQAFVDVFSCRPFSPDDVLAVLEEHFGPHRVSERDVQTRGRHWDADVAKEMSAWADAR